MYYWMTHYLFLLSAPQPARCECVQYNQEAGKHQWQPTVQAGPVVAGQGRQVLVILQS